jgi:hypothetical protein
VSLRSTPAAATTITLDGLLTYPRRVHRRRRRRRTPTSAADRVVHRIGHLTAASITDAIRRSARSTSELFTAM